MADTGNPALDNLLHHIERDQMDPAHAMAIQMLILECEKKDRQIAAMNHRSFITG